MRIGEILLSDEFLTHLHAQAPYAGDGAAGDQHTHPAPRSRPAERRPNSFTELPAETGATRREPDRGRPR